MKTITITLSDGQEIVGVVINEEDSLIECIDQDNKPFKIETSYED